MTDGTDGTTPSGPLASHKDTRIAAHYVAIDLGAGSGRALVGAVGGGRIDLKEVHRFRYEPRHRVEKRGFKLTFG